MASEPKAAAAQANLDELAFEIYSKAVAAAPMQVGGERIALDAYRKAEAFIAVREKIAAGELDTSAAEASPFADCSLPNQPSTHPLNLVAKEHVNRKTGVKTPGDLQKVNRIKKFLDMNPVPDSEHEEEFLRRLNSEFKDLHWDMPTTNVARAVFPAYCKN
jgi:hypothetical protein